MEVTGAWSTGRTERFLRERTTPGRLTVDVDRSYTLDLFDRMSAREPDDE